MRLRLIRHATLLVELAGRCVLVDPMLDPAGPAAAGAGHGQRPPQPAVRAARAGRGARRAASTAILVTHLHADHLDETAVDLLPKDVPLLCQPPDEGVLRDRGFADVRPVDDALELDGVPIARTDGRHGTGEIADMLAPVSGFVLARRGEPTLYVAGDTVWCDEVRRRARRRTSRTWSSSTPAAPASRAATRSR